MKIEEVVWVQDRTDRRRKISGSVVHLQKENETGIDFEC